MAFLKQLDNDEYSDDDKWGVENVIDEINEEAPKPELPEEEFEDEDFGDLSEVEIRLEEANCLKALLNNSLFEEPLSPIAKRVERKIRTFIHAELRTLLGITVVKAEAKLFTDDELSVLKALANKALSKFGLPKETPETPPLVHNEPAPTVRKPIAADEPVRVRRTRAPKVKISPRAENATPVTTTPEPETNKSTIKEITLPNGMVTTINTATQVKGNGGYPTLSPTQQADFYEQEALTSLPTDGILGLATAAVNRLNSLTPEE